MATTSYMASANTAEVLSWERNGYKRKDVFDDRVTFFNTQLQPGTYSYTYLARVTYARKFHVLPAQAYLTYAREVWGRSDSSRVMFGADD
jgi:uncharacterized protein YfaS (alpha-2-macroglobulin family)